jgi:hypothetical protein
MTTNTWIKCLEKGAPIDDLSDEALERLIPERDVALDRLSETAFTLVEKLLDKPRPLYANLTQCKRALGQSTVDIDLRAREEFDRANKEHRVRMTAWHQAYPDMVRERKRRQSFAKKKEWTPQDIAEELERNMQRVVDDYKKAVAALMNKRNQ